MKVPFSLPHLKFKIAFILTLMFLLPNKLQAQPPEGAGVPRQQQKKQSASIETGQLEKGELGNLTDFSIGTNDIRDAKLAMANLSKLCAENGQYQYTGFSPQMVPVRPGGNQGESCEFYADKIEHLETEIKIKDDRIQALEKLVELLKQKSCP